MRKDDMEAVAIVKSVSKELADVMEEEAKHIARHIVITGSEADEYVAMSRAYICGLLDSMYIRNEIDYGVKTTAYEYYADRFITERRQRYQKYREVNTK